MYIMIFSMYNINIMNERKTMKEKTVYEINGYKDRQDYLDSLADEYGDNVYYLADMLGESEDFDGLVSNLEDM